MKKIAYFSIGIPDPSQGGSGIINYYILKELINKNYLVDAFFLSNNNFLSNHASSFFFDKIKNKLNNFHFIDVKQKKNKKLNFFYNHLKDVHNVKLCEEYIKKINTNYDTYISLDLGWAIALKKKNNVLSILGDPYHSRIIHGHNESILKKIKAISTSLKFVVKKIGKDLNGKNKVVVNFSKNHVDEYCSKGLYCKHLNYFSTFYSYNKIKKKFNSKGPFIITHLGDLSTTASRKNVDFLRKSLKVLSEKINRKIILFFIGRYAGNKNLFLNYKNIKIKYMGHIKDLDKKLIKSDAVISVADYPVGTRTRLLNAMSLGVPCIAHISSSLGLHQLKDREDILFCRNVNEFVKIVILLSSDINLQKKLSRNARKTWNKNFNPKINVQKILDKINC